MSTFVVTKGELYEIVKKRKLSTIEGGETDQEDGRRIEENVDELIIENEAKKFIGLFEIHFQKRQKKLNLILKMA